jgi:hypothetical protein
MKVKRGYSYVDERGKVYPQTTIVKIDDDRKHDKSQLWKLESLNGPTPTPKTAPKVSPKADPVSDVKNLIEDLGSLVEDEPPKVIPDPDAKKPGTGIEKEKAESMLDRVKQFVEQQKQESKK